MFAQRRQVAHTKKKLAHAHSFPPHDSTRGDKGGERVERRVKLGNGANKIRAAGEDGTRNVGWDRMGGDEMIGVG